MTGRLAYALRSGARHLGLEPVRARQRNATLLGHHLRHLFGELRVNCVLDVGAQHGVYGRWLRSNGYGGTIISFEPVSTSYDRLAAACDPRWRAVRCAIGSEDGESEIRVARLSQLSSFRTRNSFSQDEFGSAMETVATETVTVRRLDSLWDEYVPADARVYLKVDTQGWDMEVLAGLGDHRPLALQTEVAVQPIYDGAPSTSLSLDTLTQMGYVPSGMFPVSLDKTMRLIEFDCVAVRADV
jgi:FkbM family methyltransferase